MLTSTSNVKRHTENGVTTDFPFNFKVDSPTELEVDSIDLSGVPTRLSYPGDFTVTGLHDNDGGYITKVAGTNGFDLLIRRVTPITQTTKLRGQTELDPVVLEEALDKLAKVDQQLSEELGRTFRSSVEGIDTELPTPEAGYALGWNATGTGLVNVPNTGADQSADLAASSGSSLIGFLQSGAGAVARTVQDKARERISTDDFGVASDGATDGTAELQLAINEASAAGRPLVIDNKTVSISTLTLANVTLICRNATLKARGTADMITLGSNVIIHGDLTLDLNNLSYCGMRGTAPDNVRNMGRITIKDAATGGGNVNGGISLAGGTDINLGEVFGLNLRQNAGAGLYRLVDLSSVVGCTFQTIDNTNGDITCNLYASQDVSGGAIHSRDCVANTCYIIDATEQVHIDDISHESGSGAGVTLSSSVAASDISIGNVSVSGSVNALDLRSGGGYRIGSLLVLDGAIVDNATGTGVTDLSIGALTSVYTSDKATRPITLTKSTNVRIAAGAIHCSFLPIGSRPIDLTGTADKFSFNGSITSSVAITSLCSIATGVAAPQVSIDVTTNYTGTRFAYSGVTDYTNLFLRVNGGVFSGAASVEALAAVPTLTLKSLDIDVGAAQSIGEFVIVGSDTGSPGTKFKIRTTGITATGVTYKTDFLDDGGNVVGTMNTGASKGMSIVLPTAATGLPSGAIWNNGGAINIVP